MTINKASGLTMKIEDFDERPIIEKQYAIHKKWAKEQGLRSSMPTDRSMWSNVNPIIKINKESDVKNGSILKLGKTVLKDGENMKHIDIYGRVYANAYTIN
jgi:hypothetical protein